MSHSRRLQVGNVTSSVVLTIEQLERWSLFGASWAAFELAENHVTVDFFSCTGELVDRGRSDDPEVLAFVRQCRPPRDS